MLMFGIFFFLYLMAWWILLWFMRKKRLDYSGKQNLEQGQYLEVLRFVGQGFVPPTAELAWLSVGFPRLLCWSGSGHTSTLAPSVHKGLPVIAVIVASWEGREIIFRRPVCSSIKHCISMTYQHPHTTCLHQVGHSGLWWRLEAVHTRSASLWLPGILQVPHSTTGSPRCVSV